jgi:hypothetical protein
VVTVAGWLDLEGEVLDVEMIGQASAEMVEYRAAGRFADHDHVR